LWDGGSLGEDEGELDKLRFIQTIKERLNADIVLGPAVEFDRSNPGKSQELKIVEDPKAYGIYVEAEIIDTFSFHFNMGVPYRSIDGSDWEYSDSTETHQTYDPIHRPNDNDYGERSAATGKGSI